MTVVMLAELDGVTLERYDQARTLMNREGNVPDGTCLQGSIVRCTALLAEQTGEWLGWTGTISARSA